MMTSLIGHSLGRYHVLEQLGEGGMANQEKVQAVKFENIEKSQKGNRDNTYVNLKRCVYSGT